MSNPSHWATRDALDAVDNAVSALLTACDLAEAVGNDEQADEIADALDGLRGLKANLEGAQ